MQRDLPAFPRRMGHMKPDVVHQILEGISRECVDALGELEPSLRPAIRDLIDADERWETVNSNPTKHNHLKINIQTDGLYERYISNPSKL